MRRLTWWGHSTAVLELDGVRILTDPVLTDRVAHLRRRRGLSPATLTQPDVVLISHLHADHLHLPSLRRLGGQAPLVVPAGARAFVRHALGDSFAERCIELPAGQETTVAGVRVRAVPAAHDGGRHHWSRWHAEAVGYVIEAGLSVWFAGDTGLHPAMSTFGPVDLALVPVGGWGPSLGPGHLSPTQAAEAVRRIGAHMAVPIHYGTLWPIGMDQVRPHLFHDPGERFADHAIGLDVPVLTPGGVLDLPS
ncbi:MBL fold metallo-hydrolase [Pilimelia columellifera]|uniref:MBL fold metallo-hydrolase n=1 Tax=Pilimelia columellifera subsp. columellifera TaxID=706583 RepID=A0ABN3NHH0_9ACTN